MLGRSLDKSNSYSNVGGREREATDIEQLDRRSADFGSVSNIEERKVSQIDDQSRSQAREVRGPIQDQEGHSGESDEGIVADHQPFNGIKEAIKNQEKIRRKDQAQAQPVYENEATSQQDEEEFEEDNRPSARKRRIKQVLYSDKSESSVDEMMEDTPSNYNIANGRLEGKSMGLKAILLFAKNQGIQLGSNAQNQQLGLGSGRQQLAQIQEEKLTPNELYEQHGWKPQSNQMTETPGRRVPVVADDSQARGRTKQTPGMAKQFKEPSVDRNRRDHSNTRANPGQKDLKNIQKNNFV